MTLFIKVKTNIWKFNYGNIPISNSRVNRGEKGWTKQIEPTNLFNQTAADVLCQLLKQQDIELFDGIIWFKSTLKTLTQSDKVKELVKYFLYLEISEGYKEPIRITNERYGDPHEILSAYRKETKDWTIVKAGDAGEFRWFFNFLIKCRSLVSKRQKISLINNSGVIFMLLAKLSTFMQDRWNRKVNTIRHVKVRERNFSDKIYLVDKETFLEIDPLFSGDAVSWYTGKPEKYDQTDRKQNLKIYRRIIISEAVS